MGWRLGACLGPGGGGGNGAEREREREVSWSRSGGGVEFEVGTCTGPRERGERDVALYCTPAMCRRACRPGSCQAGGSPSKSNTDTGEGSGP